MLQLLDNRSEGNGRQKGQPSDNQNDSHEQSPEHRGIGPYFPW